MNLELLERLLAPICPPEKLLKVFQFGSRVWGTAGPDTDWDFFVVIDGYEGKIHPELDKSLVDFDVDVSVYSVSQWKELLLAHDMLILICEFFPQPFVWKNTYDAGVQISLKTLVRGVSKEMGTCLSMSKQHFVKNGDKRTGVKNFVHATRYISFGTQLATRGTLYDLGTSNTILKEAMEMLAQNRDKDYDFFLSFYKPIIVDRGEKFYEMIRKTIKNVIEEKIDPVMAKEASIGRTLIKFLDEHSLADLCRYFSVTSTLQRQEKDSKTYLLNSQADSPAEHPLSTKCASTLVRFHEPTKRWNLVAIPFGYIAVTSLEDPISIPPHLRDSDGNAFAVTWRTHEVKIVIWFDFENRSWQACTSAQSLNSRQVVDQFWRYWKTHNIEFPVDEGIVATWLFTPENSRSDFEPLRLVCVSKLHPSFTQGNIDTENHQSDSRYDAIFALATKNSNENLKFPSSWPIAEFEKMDSEQSVALRVSELETHPFRYKGLYFPHIEGGKLLESRSFSSYALLSRIEEQREEKYQVHHALKHIALAICCVRNDASEEFFPRLDKFATEAIRKDIDEYKTVSDRINFFWSIVKPHLDDVRMFNETMAKLQFWSRIVAALRKVQAHPSRDPITMLNSSPTRAYHQHAETFCSPKIEDLIKTVKLQLQSSSATSSPSTSSVDDQKLPS